LRADFRHDEIAAIADDQRLSPDERRVMIDARKRVAAKQVPKKYGTHLEIQARPTLEQLVLASMKREEDEARGGRGRKETSR